MSSQYLRIIYSAVGSGECQMRADTLSSGRTVDDSWDESEDCQQNVDEKVGSAS